MAGGLAVGGVVSLWLARLVGGLLYHRVQPSDPLNVVSAVVVLSVVGLLAAWLPARRAARIDPLAALREQ